MDKKLVDKKQLVLWSIMEKRYPITGEGTLVKADEKILIADLGEMMTKVDSGNDGYNVIHVDEYELADLDPKTQQPTQVYFKTMGKVLSKPLVEWIDVKKGSDVEKRPVVTLDISFAGKNFQGVKFSLANRDGMDKPILIGRPFLEEIKAEIQF